MTAEKTQLKRSSSNPSDKELESQQVNIDVFAALAEEEKGHDIKYRTLSWQKAAFLLFGEYVCLAILALAWSWSVLGWTCGFFITFGLGVATWCGFHQRPINA